MSPFLSRAGALAVLCLCACSSSSSSVRGDNDITAAGTCPTHGAQSVNEGYPPSALPTGACNIEGSCNISINIATCCAVDQSPVDEFHCECSDGAWHCVDQYPGGGACVCVDAGATDSGS